MEIAHLKDQASNSNSQAQGQSSSYKKSSKFIPPTHPAYVITSNFSSPHISQLQDEFDKNYIAMSMQTSKKKLAKIPDTPSDKYFIVTDDSSGPAILQGQFLTMNKKVIGYPVGNTKQQVVKEFSSYIGLGHMEVNQEQQGSGYRKQEGKSMRETEIRRMKTEMEKRMETNRQIEMNGMQMVSRQEMDGNGYSVTKQHLELRSQNGGMQKTNQNINIQDMMSQRNMMSNMGNTTTMMEGTGSNMLRQQTSHTNMNNQMIGQSGINSMLKMQSNQNSLVQRQQNMSNLSSATKSKIVFKQISSKKQELKVSQGKLYIYVNVKDSIQFNQMIEEVKLKYGSQKAITLVYSIDQYNSICRNNNDQSNIVLMSQSSYFRLSKQFRNVHSFALFNDQSKMEYRKDKNVALLTSNSQSILTFIQRFILNRQKMISKKMTSPIQSTEEPVKMENINQKDKYIERQLDKSRQVEVGRSLAREQDRQVQKDYRLQQLAEGRQEEMERQKSKIDVLNTEKGIFSQQNRGLGQLSSSANKDNFPIQAIRDNQLMRVADHSGGNFLGGSSVNMQGHQSSINAPSALMAGGIGLNRYLQSGSSDRQSKIKLLKVEDLNKEKLLQLKNRKMMSPSSYQISHTKNSPQQKIGGSHRPLSPVAEAQGSKLQIFRSFDSFEPVSDAISRSQVGTGKKIKRLKSKRNLKQGHGQTQREGMNLKVEGGLTPPEISSSLIPSIQDTLKPKDREYQLLSRNSDNKDRESPERIQAGINFQNKEQPSAKSYQYFQLGNQNQNIPHKAKKSQKKVSISSKVSSDKGKQVRFQPTIEKILAGCTSGNDNGLKLQGANSVGSYEQPVNLSNSDVGIQRRENPAGSNFAIKVFPPSQQDNQTDSDEDNALYRSKPRGKANAKIQLKSQIKQNLKQNLQQDQEILLEGLPLLNFPIKQQKSKQQEPDDDEYLFPSEISNSKPPIKNLSQSQKIIPVIKSDNNFEEKKTPSEQPYQGSRFGDLQVGAVSSQEQVVIQDLSEEENQVFVVDRPEDKQKERVTLEVKNGDFNMNLDKLGLMMALGATDNFGKQRLVLKSQINPPPPQVYTLNSISTIQNDKIPLQNSQKQKDRNINGNDKFNPYKPSTFKRQSIDKTLEGFQKSHGFLNEDNSIPLTMNIPEENEKQPKQFEVNAQAQYDRPFQNMKFKEPQYVEPNISILGTPGVNYQSQIPISKVKQGDQSFNHPEGIEDYFGDDSSDKQKQKSTLEMKNMEENSVIPLKLKMRKRSERQKNKELVDKIFGGKQNNQRQNQKKTLPSQDQPYLKSLKTKSKQNHDPDINDKEDKNGSPFKEYGIGVKVETNREEGKKDKCYTGQKHQPLTGRVIMKKQKKRKQTMSKEQNLSDNDQPFKQKEKNKQLTGLNTFKRNEDEEMQKNLLKNRRKYKKQNGSIIQQRVKDQNQLIFSSQTVSQELQKPSVKVKGPYGLPVLKKKRKLSKASAQQIHLITEKIPRKRLQKSQISRRSNDDRVGKIYSHLKNYGRQLYYNSGSDTDNGFHTRDDLKTREAGLARCLPYGSLATSRVTENLKRNRVSGHKRSSSNDIPLNRSPKYSQKQRLDHQHPQTKRIRSLSDLMDLSKFQKRIQNGITIYRAKEPISVSQYTGSIPITSIYSKQKGYFGHGNDEGLRSGLFPGNNKKDREGFETNNFEYRLQNNSNFSSNPSYKRDETGKQQPRSYNYSNLMPPPPEHNNDYNPHKLSRSPVPPLNHSNTPNKISPGFHNSKSQIQSSNFQFQQAKRSGQTIGYKDTGLPEYYSSIMGQHGSSSGNQNNNISTYEAGSSPINETFGIQYRQTGDLPPKPQSSMNSKYKQQNQDPQSHEPLVNQQIERVRRLTDKIYHNIMTAKNDLRNHQSRQKPFGELALNTQNNNFGCSLQPNIGLVKITREKQNQLTSTPKHNKGISKINSKDKIQIRAENLPRSMMEQNIQIQKRNIHQLSNTKEMKGLKIQKSKSSALEHNIDINSPDKKNKKLSKSNSHEQCFLNQNLARELPKISQRQLDEVQSDDDKSVDPTFQSIVLFLVDKRRQNDFPQINLIKNEKDTLIYYKNLKQLTQQLQQSRNVYDLVYLVSFGRDSHVERVVRAYRNCYILQFGSSDVAIKGNYVSLPDFSLLEEVTRSLVYQSTMKRRVKSMIRNRSEPRCCQEQVVETMVYDPQVCQYNCCHAKPIPQNCQHRVPIKSSCHCCGCN